MSTGKPESDDLTDAGLNDQSEDGRALVAAFYQFVPIDDFESMKAPLQQRCEDLGLAGTILLAAEGINGTIAGPEQGVRRLLERLQQDKRLAGLKAKFSWATPLPFYRMKVRLKREIVSLGVPGIDPRNAVGEYVDPRDWNALIQRDDVRLIDTRNDYEVSLGSFSGAEDPQTRSFRDFPAWAEKHLDPEEDENIAMFCTGGIRCEKSTAYLKSMGFKNVFHLDGGILNYLEQIKPEESLWNGDCFVFDNRVTVDHELRQGDLQICPACRMPVTEEDKASPLFEVHVSCPKCHDRLTPEKREGLLERARQMALAKQRGEKHLGSR